MKHEGDSVADADTVSRALTSLLAKGGIAESVIAVRGEMFFHLAVVYDLVGRASPEVAEQAGEEAARCREMGRSMLGGVA